MTMFTLAVPPDDQYQYGRCLLRVALNTLNARSTSDVPKASLDVLTSQYLPHLTWKSPMLAATMSEAATAVDAPALLSRLIESSLEAFFKEEEPLNGEWSSRLASSAGDAWTMPLSVLTLPADAKKMEELICESVRQGHGLVLFARLKRRLAQCAEQAKEEEKLLPRVLQWLKDMPKRYYCPIQYLFTKSFLALVRKPRRCSCMPHSAL